MVALNVVAAETDEEAEFLATSQYQSFLNLIRQKPGKIPPPVEDMDSIWNEREKALGQFAHRRFDHRKQGNGQKKIGRIFRSKRKPMKLWSTR